MLGRLPVKHFLPLVCVNVGTAFSAMPATKITRLKINTCNTTVLRWPQLASNAFLIYLPSLPLAWVWERIDVIKHEPGWSWQKGWTWGWKGDGCDGSVVRRSALGSFSPSFCPVGSLLVWTQHRLRAAVPHLHGSDKDGVETGWENYCCLWQLVLMDCA